MEGKFDIALYNDEFFEWHVKYAREYSIRTMDWYIEDAKPTSIVDIGCGIGSYLESAYNHGIYFRGFEISESARKYTPEHIRRNIFYHDCTKPFNFEKKFHTVLSFETAEHIQPEGTDQFIYNLINFTGEILLFTAAPPGQEGTGHINLKPREFWIERFNEFLDYDLYLTTYIGINWRKLGAPNYICDNLIVCTV